MYIVSGNVHFIADNASVIEAITEEEKQGKDYVLNTQGKEFLKELSVTELTNQKATLKVYTQKYPLDFKFNFEKEEPIKIRIKPIEPTEKASGQFNIFRVLIKTPVDYYADILAVPKKESEIKLVTPDMAEKERLSLEMLRAQENVEQTAARIELAKQRTKTSFDRAQRDLDFGYTKQAINTAASIVGATIGGGYSFLTGGFLTSAVGKIKKGAKSLHKTIPGAAKEAGKTLVGGVVGRSAAGIATNVMDLMR